MRARAPAPASFNKRVAVKKVSLNPGSRVVGFGNGTVYVVRTDDDDLQWLQHTASPDAVIAFIYDHLEAGTFRKDVLDEWLRANTKALTS